MALPKINSSPEYELTIPSTKEKTKFRPFVVKEQKILLIALESRDQKQILGAITNTIDACLNSKIDITNLTSFDLEYVFTQIRAKSVGEVSNIRIKCSDCDELNDYSVNLAELKVEGLQTHNIIKLTDKVYVKLKTPNYGSIIDNEYISKATTQTDTLFEMLILSLDSLNTDDERISFKDETREDIINFIDGLNPAQLNDLLSWVNSTPALKHTAAFKCIKCGHDNNVILQGLSDFF